MPGTVVLWSIKKELDDWCSDGSQITILAPIQHKLISIVRGKVYELAVLLKVFIYLLVDYHEWSIFATALQTMINLKGGTEAFVAHQIKDLKV